MEEIEFYDWFVIGAGPSGIATVGKLLDVGIQESKIGWIDPNFKVGDLGTKWKNVPSNTSVDSFLTFFKACKSFQFDACKENLPILNLPLHSHCLLNEVAKPLQWITKKLALSVKTSQETALNIHFNEAFWEIRTTNRLLYTKNVVLCTGAEPIQLKHEAPLFQQKILPLEIALDPEKLEKEISSTDVVGIFGSSHSAVLALANAVKISKNEVYNFYRTPLKYAILPTDQGLRAFGALFAKENLEDPSHKQFKRFHISEPHLSTHLSKCTHLIYGVGFKSRILHFSQVDYEKSTGIMGHGLFGLGIGFPPLRFDSKNQKYYPTTLQSMMRQLDLVFPLWLHYANHRSFPAFPWEK